ncbi:single-stranded DNA-binding protein [Candidatus Kaiserbacteria bacterium]|nr:single-stranded DNA-binding protein [Candidatus Kaiserbacteria bacterium]
MGYQQTIIIGNVGKAPELRYTQGGTAVCDFSVAVTESWKDTNGERKEKTTWIKVTAWRALAEVCNQYVHKGMQIMVVGSVEANAYMNKSGEAAASLDLTARDIQFLGGRNASGQSGGDAPDDIDYSQMDAIPF